MCEIVVLLKDPELSGDAHVDNGRHRRGDVIDVLPDGSDWGERVRTHPHWLIVKLPGVPIERMQQFLAEESERERGGNKIVRHPRRRLFYLNLNGLHGMTRRGESVTLSIADLEARLVRKPPPEDPDVLG